LTTPKSSKGTDSSGECGSSCGQTAEPVLEEQVASELSSPPSAPSTVDLSSSPPRSPSESFHHPRTQQGKLYKGFYSAEHILDPVSPVSTPSHSRSPSISSTDPDDTEKRPR
jgi:hypothetical protein